MKKKKEINNSISIHEVARFKCAYTENAQNIAYALARAGRFVQLQNEDGALVAVIYERND